MNKIAFIFSGYNKDQVFTDELILSCDNYKQKVLEILKHIENNTECMNIPLDVLEKSQNIEQCNFILNVALAKTLILKGIKPDYLCGFSVGDIHALNYSGVLSLECAMKALDYREDIFRKDRILKTSSMVLIEEMDYSLAEILISKYKGACPICYNTKTSTTILVQDKFKDALCHDIKYAGGKTRLLSKSLVYSLPVNLKNTELSLYLINSGYNSPQIPTYINTSLFNKGENTASDICKTITDPVVFVKKIEDLVSMGVDLFIEIGGNGLLMKDIRSIDKDLTVYSVNDLESADHVAQKLLMHV